MSELEPSADPFQLIGTTIEGKYRVASVIGDGGFGVVYRGVHKGFGELIAIKCLKLPAALADDQREGLLEQLREEGRLLHRLSKATSGIVQALDVGAFTTPAGAWVPYLVLEWLEGETLAEHLQKRRESALGPLPLSEAIALLEPAARALAVAHQHKIAHRDVKPPNLFVLTSASPRTVKVLDFGIAKVLTDYPSFTEALAATKVGPSAFTPRYGAPEQFNKQRGATGPWTDVFALGLILVEVITGKKALDGDDPTQLYIASADPVSRPTPRARGAAVSDAVEEVLAKALHIEPKHRYADAGEFWDALVAAAKTSASASAERSEKGAPVITPLPAGGVAGPSTMELKTGDLVTVDPSGAATQAPEKSRPPAPPMPPLSLQSTMPAELLSTREATDKPVVVVNDKSGEEGLAGGGAARAEGRSAGASAAPAASRAVTKDERAERRSADDPMAETPPARRPSGGVPARAADKSPPRTSEPGKAAAPPPDKRSTWVWVAVLAGISIAGLTMFSQLTGSGSQRPKAFVASARPLPSTPAMASARATATAKAAAGSTAEAEAPSVSADPSSAPQAAAPPPEDMVLIAAGSLLMGAGTTARQVTLSRPFYIDRMEVTARAYQACVAKRMCSAADHVAVTAEAQGGEQAAPAAPSDFVETWTRRCNTVQGHMDDPINCVDFSNAEGYCRWRGRRLPTEAEWEFAARSVEGRAFPWGAEAPDCGRACYDKNGGCRSPADPVSTCPVADHQGDKTREGVFDLGGNVSEWVSDGYTDRPAGGIDPRGDPSAPLRVVRGGSFLDQVETLSATWRTGRAPVTAHVSIGFRCAMDGPAAAP